jgi:DNA repair photolyase
MGCDHACAYCYNHRIFGTRWTNEPKPLLTPADIDRTFHRHAGSREAVLLSFVGDPYCAADRTYRLTRHALEQALECRVPISILTKGGKRCLCELDLQQRFGASIQVGATLTGVDGLETGAAPTSERLEALATLQEYGVPTWASLEPVIDVKASLGVLQKAVEVCSMVKIGKVNNWGNQDQDWAGFLKEAVDIAERASVRYYVKDDLFARAGKPAWIGEEHRMPDLYQPRPFGGNHA